VSNELASGYTKAAIQRFIFGPADGFEVLPCGRSTFSDPNRSDVTA
jgi:hypothetical protein